MTSIVLATFTAASLALATASWAEGLEDVAPCLAPFQSINAIEAEYVNLGWISVTDGQEFIRATRATSEIRYATLQFRREFETSDDAAAFLNGAHARAELSAANARVLVRGALNVQIEELDFGAYRGLTCYLTGRRVALVEESLTGEPIEFPRGRMSFNYTQVDWPDPVGDVPPGNIDLVRLILPFPASLSAAGGQGVIVSARYPMEESQ
jgi:hypothetical protein